MYIPNDRPKRILFIGEAVSLAHIGRPSVLARWAREAGHEIHFACGSAMLAVAEQEQLAPTALPTISSAAFYERVRAGRFFYTKNEMTTYITSECELIRRIKPDVVVSDFRLTLAISTALTNVPLISTINAYWSPGYDCPLPAPQAGLAGFLPRSIRERLFTFVRPLALKHFAEPLNEIRVQHGLSRLRDLREHYTAGTACAYMDLPNWIPDTKLPAGHACIGPVTWAPALVTQPDLGRLGQTRPLAYVSLGSSANPVLLKKILKSLLEAGMDMVVSGVNDSCGRALRKNGPELKQRAYLGQLFDPTPCLAQARIVICHGGSGTIYQALRAGVPVLCLCSNGDQVLASRAAARWGACRWLHEESVTAIRIKKQVATLIKKADPHAAPTSSPTTCARSVRHWLEHHDTRRCWIKFLNQFLEPAHNRESSLVPRVANSAVHS